MSFCRGRAPAKQREGKNWSALCHCQRLSSGSACHSMEGRGALAAGGSFFFPCRGLLWWPLAAWEGRVGIRAFVHSPTLLPISPCWSRQTTKQPLASPLASSLTPLLFPTLTRCRTGSAKVRGKGPGGGQGNIRRGCLPQMPPMATDLLWTPNQSKISVQKPQ